MCQRNQKGFPCIISIIIIIILIFNNLIYPSSSSAYVDELYASCAPVSSTCGLSIDIVYPFWDATRFSYCGHPGFALECQGNYLTIEINNQTYNVLKINYKSNVLTISKQAFDQGPCPTTESELTNSTLDLTLFNFTSSSQNATLFYDCERRQGGEIAPFSFTCPLDGYSNPTYTIFSSDLNFLAIDKKWKDKLSKMCAIKIDIPVFKTAIADLDNGKTNIIDIVTKGFELKWMIDESQCQVCSASNGRCGFNHTSGQPICFFPQGSLNNTFSLFNGYQDITSSNNKTTFTGIATIAAAACWVLILSFLDF